jgi:hypothetical protein
MLDFNDYPKGSAVLLGAFLGGFGVSLWGMYYQPGPWWLWASDVCPDPATTCGQMPLGPIIALFGGVVIVGLLSQLSVHGVERLWEVRADA